MLQEINVPAGAVVKIEWEEDKRILEDSGYKVKRVKAGIRGEIREDKILLFQDTELGFRLAIPNMILETEDAEEE